MSVFLVGLFAGGSWAGHESLFLVSQPLDIEGPPTLIVPVPYIGYSIDWTDPAAEILLTTASDSIWCDGKIQDRNGAVRYGIRFEKGGTAPSEGSGLRPHIVGDTVLIRVDVRRIDRSFVHDGRIIDKTESANRMLAATLWSGLRNARVSWPKIRYVHYEIMGDEAFRYHAGVYSLEKISVPGYEYWESMQVDAQHRAPR